MKGIKGFLEKKTNWFNSTFFVLLMVFLGFVIIGTLRYGWERVLDESIFYIIGATFTGIVVILVGIAWKKERDIVKKL